MNFRKTEDSDTFHIAKFRLDLSKIWQCKFISKNANVLYYIQFQTLAVNDALNVQIINLEIYHLKKLLIAFHILQSDINSLGKETKL